MHSLEDRNIYKRWTLVEINSRTRVAMKTSMSSLVPLLFLIFFVAGETKAFPVYDMRGQLVEPYVNYYIIPVRGGTVGLEGANGNDTCPFLVVQNDFVSLDTPTIAFLPADSQVQAIDTSTILNIKCTVSPGNCGNSMVWRLYKKISEARFISTDGVEGNPGSQTTASWFRIGVATEGGYQFQFCLNETGDTCSDIGIYVGDDNIRYLGLADKLETFRILFDRADPVMVS